MSSHREAPEISKDPVADNCDLYAFVSPDHPSTVTILSNFIPLQGPAGGPNFYEFGDDVLYHIYIDNDGDGMPEIEYQFRFTSSRLNDSTFLYNTGPIMSLDDPNWNSRQVYEVIRFDAKARRHAGAAVAAVAPDGQSDALDANTAGPDGPGPAFPNGPYTARQVVANAPCPPCNIGPRSTPNYEQNLGIPAVQTVPTGELVFAGQRAEPFYVDLGSIFDLGGLRPFNMAHLIPLATTNGVDATKDLNISTIAIQVPITMLTANGQMPSAITDPTSTIGVWSAASRRRAVVRHHDGTTSESGPWVQVSRLGMPLINEVIIPLGQKDDWNHDFPQNDAEYVPNYQHPELAKLLPVLYPGVFPNLAGLTAERTDLEAILLTGIPSGVVPGFQNFTGPTPADQLRLNVAVPPSASPSPLGILGGDLAGFPNGRRLQDDIVAIELRAIAGATYPLVNKSYTPDGAAALLTQGIPTPPTDGNGARYKNTFPYAGAPHDGYDTPAS
jgi:hypothetical protein